MSRYEFKSLELAQNTELPTTIYECEISENSTKITVGTLPSLEFGSKIDDFVDVVVCFIESPARFFVQLKDNDADAVNLKTKMMAMYSNLATVKPLQNPHRGQYCAVMHGTDNLWYRAIVVHRLSPTQLEVYFLDYGNREKVPMPNVKELHPECSVLPPQAIECKLRDVENKDDPNLVKKFRDVVFLQNMVIRLIELESTTISVTLFKVVGDTDFNVNDYLLGKAAPIPIKLSTNNNPVSAATTSTVSKLKAEFPRRSLKINDTIKGQIIQAKSPSEFWITTARESGFSALPDSMWQYSKGKGFVPLSDVRVGRSCIMLLGATSSEDYPMYCRAVITDLNGKDCDLLLVDYAETKKKQPVSGLFEVPPEFTKLDCQANKCKLAQMDESRAQFDDEAKKKAFVDGVDHKEVVAVVKGFDEEGTAVVDVRFDIEKRDLRDICKKVARGALDAFGYRQANKCRRMPP